MQVRINSNTRIGLPYRSYTTRALNRRSQSRLALSVRPAIARSWCLSAVHALFYYDYVYTCVCVVVVVFANGAGRNSQWANTAQTLHTGHLHSHTHTFTVQRSLGIHIPSTGGVKLSSSRPPSVSISFFCVCVVRQDGAAHIHVHSRMLTPSYLCPSLAL